MWVRIFETLIDEFKLSLFSTNVQSIHEAARNQSKVDDEQRLQQGGKIKAASINVDRPEVGQFQPEQGGRMSFANQMAAPVTYMLYPPHTVISPKKFILMRNRNLMILGGDPPLPRTRSVKDP
jgi:hypothetical protein